MADWFWREWQHLWLPCVLLVALLTISVWGHRRWQRHRRRRIAKHALDAEHAALALLRHHGYAIIGTQVRKSWTVQHGSRTVNVHLRADALVRRGQRRFIAEVKSSALVADLKHGPTRRQLLEYALAYDTDGVLLIDMHTEQLEEVTFPGLLRPTYERPIWSLLTAGLFAFFVGAWCAKQFAYSENPLTPNEPRLRREAPARVR